MCSAHRQCEATALQEWCALWCGDEMKGQCEVLQFQIMFFELCAKVCNSQQPTEMRTATILMAFGNAERYSAAQWWYTQPHCALYDALNIESGARSPLEFRITYLILHTYNEIILYIKFLVVRHDARSSQMYFAYTRIGEYGAYANVSVCAAE